jgi:hypothetical protein
MVSFLVFFSVYIFFSIPFYLIRLRCSDISQYKTNNALVPVHSPLPSSTPHFPWGESTYNLPKLLKMDPHSNYNSEFDDSSSESGSTPSSPKRYADNTIQCVLEGEYHYTSPLPLKKNALLPILFSFTIHQKCLPQVGLVVPRRFRGT